MESECQTQLVQRLFHLRSIPGREQSLALQEGERERALENVGLQTHSTNFEIVDKAPRPALQMMPSFCSRRRRKSVSVTCVNGIRIDNNTAGNKECLNFICLPRGERATNDCPTITSKRWLMT
jgi:hypothetical protein